MQNPYLGDGSLSRIKNFICKFPLYIRIYRFSIENLVCYSHLWLGIAVPISVVYGFGSPFYKAILIEIMRSHPIALRNTSQNKTIYGNVQCHRMVFLMTGPYICSTYKGNLYYVRDDLNMSYCIAQPNNQLITYIGTCNDIGWSFWWQDLTFVVRQRKFHWFCFKKRIFEWKMKISSKTAIFSKTSRNSKAIYHRLFRETRVPPREKSKITKICYFLIKKW